MNGMLLCGCKTAPLPLHLFLPPVILPCYLFPFPSPFPPSSLLSCFFFTSYPSLHSIPLTTLPSLLPLSLTQTWPPRHTRGLQTPFCHKHKLPFTRSMPHLCAKIDQVYLPVQTLQQKNSSMTFNHPTASMLLREHLSPPPLICMPSCDFDSFA